MSKQKTFVAIIILLVCLVYSTPQVSQSQALSPAQQVFIDELAKDTWTYLSSDWATDNHLPWSWRSDTMVGGDYANTTEIGLYMLTYIGAFEMGETWSPSLTAVETELTAVLDQLRAWQSGTQTYQPHGPNAYNNSVFYQWYWINWNPPVVGDNTGTNHDVPSIDNAFLAASLITIREWAKVNGKAALTQKADAILQDMNFMLWYDSNQHIFMFGGSNNPLAGIPANYYSNENRIINFVARALGQLTAAEYQASLNALIQPSAIYDNNTAATNDDIAVAKVAWDGSYFTYTGPALFIREMQTPYGTGTIEPVTQAQIAYAQNKGYSAWGLSDCYDINALGYIPQGAPPIAPANAGTLEAHAGVVTPHASAMALITSFAGQSATNLQTLASSFPAVYDANYGFRDSVMARIGDPDYGDASSRFSALAQEWLFLSIANAQTGFIWNYFYRDAGVMAAHNEMFAAPALTAPANGLVSLNQQPVFSWNPVPGAVRYEIELAPADESAVLVSDATSLSYKPAGPLLVTDYLWRVRSTNASGVASLWSETRIIRLQSPPAAGPLRNFYTISTPTLNWNRVTWATQYELQVDESPAFMSPLAFTASVPANEVSKATSPLADGTYYWRVRGKRSDIIGNWSVIDSFQIDTP
jgi:hypothetical protein